MKKIFLLLPILFICLGTAAQEHLKFKNVPIDGPKKAFLEALQKNEFHLLEDTEAGASLMGRFTGKTAYAFVIPTTEGNVCRVAVNFDAPDDWMTLRLDYFTLLRSLTFKYGKPEEVAQEFQFPYSDGDGQELEALQKGKGRWYARFTVTEGTIHLFIANNPMSMKPAIGIFYEDALNCQRQDELNSADL